MQKCARCGHRVCSPNDKIAITKIWHKCCFSCYNCNRPLNKQTAKIFCGEIFCSCCIPVCQPHRVISLPSCEFQPNGMQCRQKTPPTPPTIIIQSTDVSSARLVHSCSCIPNCRCTKEKSVNKICQPCKQPYRKKFVIRRPCNSPCYCCEGTKFESYVKSNCRPTVRRFAVKIPRCIRCGDKVYAAEKVMTSVGAFHTFCFNCCCCYKALCLKTMYEAGGEIYCKQCYNGYIGTNFYGYR